MIRWLPVALAGGLLVLHACGPSEDLSSLVGTATPQRIDNAGQVTTIRVVATDATGKPGTGSVTFSSPAGSLVQPVTVSLANGAAEATFSCAVSADTRCVGDVRVRASWARAAGELATTVRVSLPAAPSDGGMMQNDGGATDGGATDGGGGAFVLGTRYAITRFGAPSAGQVVLQNLDDGGVLFGLANARAMVMSANGIFFVDEQLRVFQYGPDFLERVPMPVDAGDADAGDVDAGDVDAGDVDGGDAGDVDAGEVDAGDVDAGAPDAGAPDAGAPDAGAPDAGSDAGTVDAGPLALWRLPLAPRDNDTLKPSACDAGVQALRVGSDGELWHVCAGGLNVVAREGGTGAITLDGGIFQAGGPNGSLMHFRSGTILVIDATGRERPVSPPQTINWVAANINVTTSGYRFPAFLEQSRVCAIVEVTFAGGFNVLTQLAPLPTTYGPATTQPFYDCVGGTIDPRDPKSIIVLLRRTSNNRFVVVRRSETGAPVELLSDSTPAAPDLTVDPPIAPTWGVSGVLLKQ